MDLEAACFEPERRDSRKVFRHSLSSPHQEVWVIRDGKEITGSLILRFHPHTCRMHSIAVSPSHQGRGIGRKLLDKAVSRARARACSRIHLEADANNKPLLTWYQSHGYTPVATLPDYYAPNWPALRLSLPLKPQAQSQP
jgi:ribosomal protein S18 acetylase RimI-like enzyme